MCFEQQVRKCWFTQRISLEYSIFLSQAALMAAKQTRNERDEDLTALRVEIQVVLKELWISFHVLVVPRTWSGQYSLVQVIASIFFVQNLKDDAAAAEEQRQEAEAEAKALRSMTQRMILTQEEMVSIFH